MNQSLGQLSNDLLMLYAKTGHNGIESLYLKTAQANFDQIKEFIPKGLLQAKVSSGTSVAFDALFKLYDDLSGDFSIVGLLDALADKSYEAGYPIVRLLGEIYAEGKYQEILAPFASLFSLIRGAVLRDEKNIPIAPSISKQQLEVDLEKITKVYADKSVGMGMEYDDLAEIMPKQKRETKQEKLISAIRYCLNEFSTELTNAAISTGKNYLVPILSQDDLPNFKQLSTTIGLPNNWSQIVGDAKVTVKQIVGRIANSSIFDLYDLIRSRALLFGGIINQDQLLNHMFEKTRNVKGIIGTDSPPENKIEVKDKHILNRGYILYVSIMLYLLLEKSK